VSEEEIYETLTKFEEFLHVGNMGTVGARWLGWAFIQGLAWLVDGLENITNTVLGIKLFYTSDGVQEFVQSIQPFLYVLLAFSILYVGYMLIMNRKIKRDQIAMNLFISIAVILLLNTGMNQADKFTDAAIDAVDVNEDGTISEKIIKEGITDVALFDVNGWKSTELEESNNIPQERIKNIQISQQIDSDFEISEGQDISEKGKDLLDQKMDYDALGNGKVVELEDSWLSYFEEKYFRYHWDFWTIIITLVVLGFTLSFISIKLAKLGYELAFNYILATIVAPADVANGQMLKEVLKRILNTFLIIIMIFISMKVYLMGTEFIRDEFEGIPYLIALIAISIAVIDGPAICERIFGIDAGLKNGWQTIMGGVAAGKAIGKGVQAPSKVMTFAGRNEPKGKGDSGGKPTLNDEMKANEMNNKKTGKNGGVNEQTGNREEGNDKKGNGVANGNPTAANEGEPLRNQIDNENKENNGSAPMSLEDEMKAAGFDTGTENETARFTTNGLENATGQTGTGSSGSETTIPAVQKGMKSSSPGNSKGSAAEAGKNTGGVASGDSRNSKLSESVSEEMQPLCFGGDSGASLALSEGNSVIENTSSENNIPPSTVQENIDSSGFGGNSSPGSSSTADDLVGVGAAPQSNTVQEDMQSTGGYMETHVDNGYTGGSAPIERQTNTFVADQSTPQQGTMQPVKTSPVHQTSVEQPTNRAVNPQTIINNPRNTKRTYSIPKNKGRN
jgi:hypothetical protein